MSSGLRGMKKKDIMQINYHIKMLKKKDIPKGRIFALFKKPGEQDTVKESTK